MLYPCVELQHAQGVTLHEVYSYFACNFMTGESPTWKTHVGHVLCKQCAVLLPPILTFVFSLVSHTGLAGSEEDSTNWKTKNRSTTVRTICCNNDLLH